jgi:hypothetical protein
METIPQWAVNLFLLGTGIFIGIVLCIIEIFRNGGTKKHRYPTAGPGRPGKIVPLKKQFRP